jgi:hypothetical protein
MGVVIHRAFPLLSQVQPNRLSFAGHLTASNEAGRRPPATFWVRSPV